MKGQCSCGAVKYELTSAPMFVHCCHCLLCQRQTGSAFVINALIETSRIEVTGELTAIAMPTESGRPHDVYRSPSSTSSRRNGPLRVSLGVARSSAEDFVGIGKELYGGRGRAHFAGSDNSA